MAELPAPENKPVQTADNILKAAFYTVALNAAFMAFEKALPFFGLVGIKQIYRFFVKKFADLLYDQLSRFITFNIVEGQVTEEAVTHAAAVDSFKQALASGDANEIDKKLEAVKAAAANLIRFGRK